MARPRPPIRRYTSWLIALSIGAAASACFIEPDAPPAWRGSCSSAGDCPGDGESCIDGLCQVPCTAATFEDDCPSSGNYTACFNGVCASACNVDDDACPAPQSCQSIEIPPEFEEFGIESFAVCGIACSDARPCPTGELCIEGACADPGGFTGSGSDSTGDSSTSESTGP